MRSAVRPVHSVRKSKASQPAREQFSVPHVNSNFIFQFFTVCRCSQSWSPWSARHRQMVFSMVQDFLLSFFCLELSYHCFCVQQGPDLVQQSADHLLLLAGNNTCEFTYISSSISSNVVSGFVQEMNMVVRVRVLLQLRDPLVLSLWFSESYVFNFALVIWLSFLFRSVPSLSVSLSVCLWVSLCPSLSVSLSNSLRSCLSLPFALSISVSALLCVALFLHFSLTLFHFLAYSFAFLQV